MAASYAGSIDFNISAEQIVNVLRERAFCSVLNLELKSENPTPTGVWFRFHHGTTFLSWGEKITITVTPLPGGITRVDASSECGLPTQVIDWGKNKQNVCNILEYVEKRLNSAAPTQAQAPTTCATKYCFNCGKQIGADANFCCFCGTKQQ